MIEVNFKDRIPLYRGQVTLTPVAGSENTYKLERADDPTEPGTPLDKATFNSIIHSRLTGRYYEMGATKTTLSTAGGATNPIPTSWSNATATGASSGGYVITASGSSGSSHPHRAFDGSTSTSWISDTNATPWIQLAVPDGIIVRKMKIAFMQRESWSTQTVLQGRNASGSWVSLATISLPNNSNLIEHTINSPDAYTAYRLNFTIYTADVITLYEWQISSWDTATYRYNYTIQEGVPATWTKEQRITVVVPNYSILGVAENTLNGIPVNTILQPNKRYDLRYTGTSFAAKEV